MNVSELKQSKFLTKNDVIPPVLVTMREVTSVNVAKEGAEPDNKFALHFDELEKPLVLNSTNGQIIAAITGSQESDGWAGKKIVLYFDPNVSFGGKLTGGIRCRAPKAGSVVADAKQGAPAPAAPVEDDSNVPF
jgi:hypothetical protein